MEIEQLLDETVEPQLAEWLRKWPDALAALNNIDDLFVGIRESRILGKVSEQVSISGPVHIGKGTKIYPFVTIEGPVIIGENVSVRSHSIIRNQAYIGSDCVVGHSADVKRSICLNGAKMQCGIFLGDSVLGCGARIGSGVITANRKFNQGEVYIKDKPMVLRENQVESFSVRSLVAIVVSERTSLLIPALSSTSIHGLELAVFCTVVTDRTSLFQLSSSSISDPRRD